MPWLKKNPKIILNQPGENKSEKKLGNTYESLYKGNELPMARYTASPLDSSTRQAGLQ